DSTRLVVARQVRDRLRVLALPRGSRRRRRALPRSVVRPDQMGSNRRMLRALGANRSLRAPYPQSCGRGRRVAWPGRGARRAGRTRAAFLARGIVHVVRRPGGSAPTLRALRRSPAVSRGRDRVSAFSGGQGLTRPSTEGG